MKTDIEIAQSIEMKPITEIARKLGIYEIYPYGKYKAKLNHRYRAKDKPPAKVILVTAITPTKAGEGKTTTAVGLGDGLSRLGKKALICLREPSLGPVFGMKGGAAGGGYAQVVPMEDINLHFTGDLHAIASAQNLLLAMMDNHIQHNNPLNIDPRQVVIRRVLDMNDRQLRSTISGLAGKTNGVPREDGFDITAACEVMAVFCLSENLTDLKENLSRIIVAYTYDGKPVTAKDLKAEGAMTALLKEAFDPNLVQTLEGTPAIIHGGPFANIAHGCNSIIATRLAMELGEYVVTEAGFGADLGAEKFINIKCRKMGIEPSVVVLVTSIRALKEHGGSTNLEKHIDNICNIYGLPCVVAINRFPTDTDVEVNKVLAYVNQQDIPCVISDVFTEGGAGGINLAMAVLSEIETKIPTMQFTYNLEKPLKFKIENVAKKVYGAKGVTYSPEASKTLRSYEEMGYGNLPICIAKTQFSFSDKKITGTENSDFSITIKKVRLSAGAGFIVVFAGDIMTMPGLPIIPSATLIDVDENGVISGLF